MAMKLFPTLLLLVSATLSVLSPLSAQTVTDQRVDEWRSEAAAGDVSAAIHLGDAYAHGRGVAQNLDEAARYYSLAADQDSEMALLKLKSLPTAYTATWWKKRATQGDANALRNLAESYTLSFDGRQPDWESAVHYYGEAADDGDELALEALKILPYEYSCAWWEKKAFERDVEAAFLAGESYEKGRGIEVDIPQAVRFYAMASELGNPVATARLQALPLAETVSWWDYRAMKGDIAASLYLLKAYGNAELGAAKVLMASKYSILAAAQGDKNCLYGILGALASFLLMVIIRPLRGIAFTLLLLLLAWLVVLVVI